MAVGEIAVKSKSLTMYQNGVKLVISGTLMIDRDLSSVDDADIQRIALKYGNPPLEDARPGLKWCSYADHWAEVAEFTAKPDTADGLHPHCKRCRAVYMRERRKRRGERKERKA